MRSFALVLSGTLSNFDPFQDYSAHLGFGMQEYVPENLDNIAGFEPPRSPPTSYSNAFPGPEDYAKEPPGVPPHLQLTLLNVPPSIDTPTSLPRPQHVILNHVYCEKTKTSKSVLALGVTHRFRSKYVTVVLYKPLKR